MFISINIDKTGLEKAISEGLSGIAKVELYFDEVIDEIIDRGVYIPAEGFKQFFLALCDFVTGIMTVFSSPVEEVLFDGACGVIDRQRRYVLAERVKKKRGRKPKREDAFVYFLRGDRRAA